MEYEMKGHEQDLNRSFFGEIPTDGHEANRRNMSKLRFVYD